MPKETTKNSRTSESAKASEKANKLSTLKKLMGSLGLCIWVGFAIIAAQFVVAFPMVWILGREKVSQPVWTTVYTALSYLFAMALVMGVPRLLKKRRRTRDELGLRGLPTFPDLGLAPVAFSIYLFLAAGLTALMSNFPWFDAGQAQNVGFSNLNVGLDRIVAFIALVVCAPIAEEIIFRGWLYGHLRSRHKLLPAILLTSVLFGLMHGQWNVGVNVFAMSVVLCLQREITGTIYSGILLHMIKNGIAFYLLYIIGLH